MKSINIKCPAKINLTLEILNKRSDGFHNIKSIMQMISLYDYLKIEVSIGNHTSIQLSGRSSEIPYDNTNLVYKAAELFLRTINKQAEVYVYIEKNIPIAAGLAGGSTDACGTLLGLNELFNKPLSKEELHILCSKLGSDLNVCLEGGCILAEQRGEKITKIDSALDYPVTLIKPAKLGISAKEAYSKYAALENKQNLQMTDKMLRAIQEKDDIGKFLHNDLELAVYDSYSELQFIKNNFPKSIMTGSGSTYFLLEKSITKQLPDSFIVIDNLHFIKEGVTVL